jgi:acetyl esterase/lipase
MKERGEIESIQNGNHAQTRSQRRRTRTNMKLLLLIVLAAVSLSAQTPVPIQDRYRLGPKYHHPIELGDAQRAIQLLRSRAAEWRLDPTRIGIMGFSAGGHLAMSASTHVATADGISSRPDISILGYPVISMTETWTHAGSRTALLGANPDPQIAASLSGEKAVTKDTPPTFIFQTSDDATVAAGIRCTTTWRCEKQACPRRCTSSSTARTARTALAWRWRIRRSQSGRSY